MNVFTPPLNGITATATTTASIVALPAIEDESVFQYPMKVRIAASAPVVIRMYGGSTSNSLLVAPGDAAMVKSYGATSLSIQALSGTARVNIQAIPDAVWVPSTVDFAIRRLYASGEQGAWYDPSDLSTLFQDSAGTTPVTAMEQPVGRMLDKSGRNNHATQATAANRPVLSSRVNLLTKTEQFDDAAWIRAGSVSVAPVVTANAFIGVDGTLTADQIALPSVTAANAISIIYQAPTQAFSTQHTASVYLRGVNGGEKVWLMWTPNGTNYNRTACVLTTSYQRFTLNYTTSASGTQFVQLGIDLRDTQQTAQPAQTIVVWGAQIETGSVATRYQRVNTATDYDSVGFSFYDKFNGTNSAIAATTGGGGSTGFFLCQAIKPTGGAGVARTLWSDTGANTGYRVRINTSNQLELAASNGAPLATPVQAAPTTATTGGTGLAASTAYYYVITALNALGETVRSNEQTITTSAGATDSVTLSWGAVTGATGYRVYRGTAAGAENVFYSTGNVTSFTDTGAASTAGSPPLVGETAYVKVMTADTLPVGTTALITAWDDGTNLNVQVNSGAVVSVARPTVAAGTAGFTIGAGNSTASNFFTGNLYPEVYRQINPSAAQRAQVQTYCKSKAGL